jgi:phenylalanyl-tRNA synthetase alpha chain
MEGVKVFTGDNVTDEEVMDDLKRTLEGLAVHLFGPETKCRWVDEYFPFTHPSLELEILYKRDNDNNGGGGDDENEEDWLEVLGCGVMRPEILHNGLAKSKDGSSSAKAWAFGLGLERLAMILFEIPDIRLFWTSDERFWKQFSEDTITKFQPYSKYPPCYKDVSFWLNDGDSTSQQQEHAPFHVNELLDILRGVAGDLVENVQLVDQFVHPKTQRESRCYRITYRSMDRSLTNEEIDELQETFRQKIQTDLHSVELR